MDTYAEVIDGKATERPESVDELKRRLLYHLKHTVGKNAQTTTDLDWFRVVARSVRNQLVENWLNTFNAAYEEDAKRIYYFSLEFLIGRSLMTNLAYMGQRELYDQALRDLSADLKKDLGVDLDLNLDRIAEAEAEAALGNGGLGRLAACIVDSMASLGMPGYGYGIRYDFGMFHQAVDEHGEQVEMPDNWLRYGNHWEFERPEFSYPVKFYGRNVEFTDEAGQTQIHWVDTEEVMAVAHDFPVPGYGGKTVTHIRLWKAKSPRDFDLKRFNRGSYIESVHHRSQAEALSRVLYPDDSTYEGKALRLRQEYFFTSASLQDIIRRFLASHESLLQLPDKIAIQLNDTHPAIAVAELMRLLMDVHQLDWETAWDITTRTFSYTNHTLMPEALEIWPAHLLDNLLPRLLRVIQDINHRFMQEVAHRFPGDFDMMRKLSIFTEGDEKSVRMGHLAFIGSHKVNGVAAIHTELMKQTIFVDLHKFFPEKITNKTNGITPRRWLKVANQPLADLITNTIGDDWAHELPKIKALEPHADDKKFQAKFQETKRLSKEKLAAYVKEHLNLELPIEAMFDVQVKRIHEYKRQLLNILQVIDRYNRIKANPSQNWVPRVVVFSGKAAPSYYIAKLIINLINNVADIVNHDPVIADRLKVVFIPNYNVSRAEVIIPAADLSEQISTAGTEASGTGNMKLALNGALTIGTRDGANIEIAEEVGEDNVFFFGLNAQEAHEMRFGGRYNPWDYLNANDSLKHAVDQITGGFFSPDNRDRFQPLIDSLLQRGDFYLLFADYPMYLECQERVDALYKDTPEWTRRAILNVARMGKFTGDRTVLDYANEIWGVKPLKYATQKKLAAE
jgi:starch phosphorylase